MEFGQGPQNNRLIVTGQGFEIGSALAMLHHQLTQRRAGIWSLPGEQFLVNDGQTVLIAEAADFALEGLRRRIHRGHAPGNRCQHPFQILDQAEIRDLDVIVDKKQVLRLDVQVLELMLRIHQVEGFRGVVQVAVQFGARNSRQALRPAFAEAVPERAVGQFRHDDQLAVDDVETLDGENEGMADGDDAFEGLEFLAGTRAFFVGGFQIAVDEFDRLEHAARRFRLPHFAEAATTKALDEPVAWQWLGHTLDAYPHGENVLNCEPRSRHRSRRGMCSCTEIG